MNITKNIRDAIDQYMAAERLSSYDLATQLGVAPSTVARWRNGKSASIHPNAWRQLKPCLIPRYLTDEPQPPPTKTRTLSPANANETVNTPVISMARAAGYAPVIHGSGSEWIREMADGDFAEWHTLPPGHLLLRVDGNSMHPILSNGSLIQVDTSRAPRSKEMVVAMIAGHDEPVVKYYFRKDYKIRLRSVNQDGNEYTFDLKAPDDEYLVWAHPVIEIKTRPMTADDLEWDD